MDLYLSLDTSYDNADKFWWWSFNINNLGFGQLKKRLIRHPGEARPEQIGTNQTRTDHFGPNLIRPDMTNKCRVRAGTGRGWAVGQAPFSRTAPQQLVLWTGPTLRDRRGDGAWRAGGQHPTSWDPAPAATASRRIDCVTSEKVWDSQKVGEMWDTVFADLIS